MESAKRRFRPKQPTGIETGTFLGRGARQVPVAHHLGLGEELAQTGDEVPHAGLLGRCERVARIAILVQTALVADADGAAVVRTGMSTHLEQFAMLRLRTVTADIEVVTDGTETARLVVTLQLFNTVVLIASRGRAMKDKIKDTLGRAHHCAVFHLGEERALVAHRLPTD